MQTNDNTKSILSSSALRVLKGLWTTARYSLAEVDFVYKPLITQMLYDENGDIDIQNIEGEFNVMDCIKKCRDLVDESVCLMLYFPMTMAVEEVGKNESRVTACLILSKIGVLDVFMCSKKGCDFVRFVIDGLVNNVNVDFEDIIASYASVEEPLSDPLNLDSGYFILENKDNFFIHDDETGQASNLSAINDVLLGRSDDFEETTNKKIKEMFDKLSKKSTKAKEEDIDFDITDLVEEFSEEDSDDNSEEDSDDLGEYIW